MKHIKNFENFEYLNEKDYSTTTRKEMAKEKEALPDGSFPIKNKTDLMNAIKSQGRAFRKADEKRKNEVLNHIEKRAKALGVKLEKSEKGNWTIAKEKE
jgi:hypothetical protein